VIQDNRNDEARARLSTNSACCGSGNYSGNGRPQTFSIVHNEPIRELGITSADRQRHSLLNKLRRTIEKTEDYSLIVISDVLMGITSDMTNRRKRTYARHKFVKAIG
jgi:hypothetical protein